MIGLIVFCAFIVFVSSGPVNRNNVCRSFPDYANIQSSKNCYYNPDQESTPTELAQRYGFTLSTHKVTTDDGYILTIFRVSKKGRDVDGQDRIPVLVQHGILVDGVSWMISGETSLAFTLVNAGFDVWLPNFRGTQFSYNHVKPGISEKNYWNFSFHEMGTLDLPKFIEFVGEFTNKTENDIALVGHSMGSTAGLIYASSRKDHADKYLRGMVLLAPVTYMKNLRGAAKIGMPLFGPIKNILELLGIYAIGQFTDLQKFLLKQTCARFPLIVPCQILSSAATGLAVEQIRPEIFPLFFLDFPNGTSLKSINHYVQIFLSGGRFQHYDYGRENNLKLYNSTLPPEYEVEKISLPTHIVYGEGDFFAGRKDAEYLFNKLNCPKGIHNYGIAHNDFAYGKQVDVLYGDIVDIINNRLLANDTEK